MMSPIGCTYSENINGPSTEPCGTPDVTHVVFDDAARIKIRCGPFLQIGLQPGKRLANKALTQLKPPDHYVMVDSAKGRTEVY